MSGTVNKVILLGNISQPIEVRTMQNGKRVASFNLATNETWKDKDGNRQKKAEFHRIVIFNDSLVTLAEKYLSKGSNVYLEGQLETRSWEKDGVKQYTTEVVLRPYRGELTLLDKIEKQETPTQSPSDYDLDSEIPFNYVGQ